MELSRPAGNCAYAACESPALLAALDYFATACLIVDRSRRPKACNQAARDMLASPDSPIRLASGQVTCRDPARTAGLADAVQAACKSPRGRPAVITVTVGNATRILVAQAADGRAVLLASQPSLPLDLDLIRTHFGLTQAEAAIAAGLTAGRSVADIAAERGAALETVRFQIKVLLGKLGVRSQSQAVALVSRSFSYLRAGA